MPFSKILIANRGEIAVRVIRACQELSFHQKVLRHFAFERGEVYTDFIETQLR